MADDPKFTRLDNSTTSDDRITKVLETLESAMEWEKKGGKETIYHQLNEIAHKWLASLVR